MNEGITPVAELREGVYARARGRVRRAIELTRSPLGQRECVYWDVRRGLEDTPRSSGAVDFWLEDPSGRVLVRGERLKVEARAERRREVLGQVDHDIHEVSRRQRAVKDALREGTGDAKALHAERRRLAELATMLCAVRAKARGRVHIGGSNAGQDAWIAAHASRVSSGPGARTMQLAIEQWEVVLADGDEVELEGDCALEAAPPGLGQGGGYRERASVRVLRAPAGGSLLVRGVGAASAPMASGAGRGAAGAVVTHPDAAGDHRFVGIVAAITGTLVLLAWWLAR